MGPRAAVNIKPYHPASVSRGYTDTKKYRIWPFCDAYIYSWCLVDIIRSAKYGSCITHDETLVVLWASVNAHICSCDNDSGRIISPQNYNFRPLVLIFPICEHRQGSTRALDIVLGELVMFPSIVCGNKRKLGDLQPLKQLFYTNRWCFPAF